MSTVEEYHRKFLEILRDHAVATTWLRSAGHGAIRALVEEIHDQGYVLGQLHADGIFPEGEETEVAEREDRLRIPELKARLKDDLETAGIPVHDALQDSDPTDRSGEAVRGTGYNPFGGLGDGRN